MFLVVGNATGYLAVLVWSFGYFLHAAMYRQRVFGGSAMQNVRHFFRPSGGPYGGDFSTVVCTE